MKYRYATNMQVDFNDGIIDINIFEDKDIKDQNYGYTVEYFPNNQSKESFESAEFWGTITKENGLKFDNYPTDFSEQDKKDFLSEILKEIICKKTIICDKCNVDVGTENEPEYYIEDEDIELHFYVDDSKSEFNE